MYEVPSCNPHLRHTTVGRTPLDKWSACRRDLYLTTHDTHNRQTSMPTAGFEPVIPANERQQTHVLDRAATGIGSEIHTKHVNTPCGQQAEYFSVTSGGKHVTDWTSQPEVFSNRRFSRSYSIWIDFCLILLFIKRASFLNQFVIKYPQRVLTPNYQALPLYR